MKKPERPSDCPDVKEARFSWHAMRSRAFQFTPEENHVDELDKLLSYE